MVGAFQLTKNGKVFNYRDGDSVDESVLKTFFEDKGYNILSFQKYARHVIVKLAKSDTFFCAKVSLSKGVNIMTNQEILWDTLVHENAKEQSIFTVPRIIEQGTIEQKYVYFVTDWRELVLLAPLPTNSHSIPVTWTTETVQKIVKLTLQVQSLTFNLPIPDESLAPLPYTKIFVEKTSRWMNQIPDQSAVTRLVTKLFSIVENGSPDLKKVVRHGDVAPWHMSELENGKIYLFDGEHAHSSGVEGYDIAYLIQRTYSVLLQSDVALHVFDEAVRSSYRTEKLKTVLASRAIGGFCDESLLSQPDYTIHHYFADWVLSL